MKEVVLKKAELVERVRANRDAHRGTFEEAIDGYRKAAVAFFGDQIDKAVMGQQFATYFQEPIPEDHSEDYEAVLDMLDMSIDDTIRLSSQEFRQYVRDDWGWKRQWTETTSNYLANS